MFGLKKLEKRAKMLILLALTGGVGVGGYANRDHPILQKVFCYVRELAAKQPSAPGESGSAETILESIVERLAPFRNPGEYEVTIEKLTLDDKEFHAGRSIDLEVRVVKYDAQGGKGVVVWDGKNSGGRALVAGRGPIVADWADRPFKVDWKTGDVYDIEIWDRKGFRPTKKFVLETEEDDGFPLRTQTHILESMSDTKTAHDRVDSTIVLKALRVAPVEPKTTEAVAERKGGRASTRR